MKMIYPDWNQSIIFEENRVNSIYLEDPIVFREILAHLVKQTEGEEGKFVLSEGEKTLPLKKYVDIVLSPFAINLEDKKFYTQIYKELQDQALGEEMYSKTQDITNEARRYLIELLDLLPYDLQLDEIMDYIAFMQSFGVKIQHDDGNLAEQLVEYIMLAKNILKKDIFVLVNLKTYFSQSEIEEIYRSLLPQKVHLIDLEQQKKDYEFSCEYDIIIDTDLCEL